MMVQSRLVYLQLRPALKLPQGFGMPYLLVHITGRTLGLGVPSSLVVGEEAGQDLKITVAR